MCPLQIWLIEKMLLNSVSWINTCVRRTHFKSVTVLETIHQEKKFASLVDLFSTFANIFVYKSPRRGHDKKYVRVWYFVLIVFFLILRGYVQNGYVNYLCVENWNKSTAQFHLLWSTFLWSARLQFGEAYADTRKKSSIRRFSFGWLIDWLKILNLPGLW